MSRSTIFQRAFEVLRLDGFRDRFTLPYTSRRVPMTTTTRTSLAVNEGSSLLRLPDELLEQIADHCTLADFVRFRSTSRRLLLATSRLFGHTYLRELHLSMVDMDQQRLQTMVQYSTHNIWQACKLTRVFIRVWPFLAECPIPHTVPGSRTLFSDSFLLHLKYMRIMFDVLPDSVHTVALVPFRPSEPKIISDRQPRCEYFHILEVTLRQSGAQIPNVVLYSDNRPVMDYEAMGDRLCHLLSAQGSTWSSKQIRPFEPGRLSTDHTTGGASMAASNLTFHGRLDLTHIGRPLFHTHLHQLRNLTLTSGRMNHSDVIGLLGSHRTTLCQVLFHNIILGRHGYRNVFHGMTRDEEHYDEYPCLTRFEIVNAWERDFDRVLDLKVSARKIVFGLRDGVGNAVGVVQGAPWGMKEKIRALGGSVRFLSAKQALREVATIL